MTNLEWLYEHDGYFNSFAKLMACLRGFATDEFTANEWLRQEHYEPNPDCSAMLYKTFTENMKHEPCSDYEPKDDAVSIMRECAETGHSMRVLRGRLGVECVTGWQARCLGKLADMVERDYMRRESVEEVMDNDRALVEENSMLARELLKLRAELEKATNNLNSANNDFENARAELTAERDNLKANNEQLHTLAGEQAAKIDELQSALDAICANLAIIAAGEPSVIADIAIETIDALIDECNTANRQCNEYRKKFGKYLDYADAIHALMDDEGLA